MLYKVDNIKIKYEHITKSNVRETIIKKLHLDENKVKHFTIMRRSLDSRFHKTEGIFYVYSVSFEYPQNLKEKKFVPYTKTYEEKPVALAAVPQTRPVIVGAGPCGLFCALRLVEMGTRSVILEQGKDIKERVKDVNAFFSTGQLNTSSNVHFGIGGAGTFSDGKLTTRIKSPDVHYVLEKMVSFGANNNILYEAKPHLGTDALRKLIDNIKAYLEENGVEIRTGSMLTDINTDSSNRIQNVTVNGNEIIECNELILSIGNAARSTYAMLEKKGIVIEPKAMAVGVRVEHPQQIINRYVYGKYSDDKRLHPAEYSLTYKDDSLRGVYSFCNCPGGYVINSSTENDGVCVNGMSFSSRDAQNANSAIVVSVTPEDYNDTSSLSGIAFQKMLEEKTFSAAGSNHFAPVQNISDFLNEGNLQGCEPTVKPGFTCSDFNEILPSNILLPLKKALCFFSKKIEGFNAGVMTGVETRTSSPVRITRDKNTLESINFKGVYPAGEGCGYSGGIMSSAVDGIKVADKICEKYL